MSKMPIGWTIAGSDSGSGAGIQADLKTFFSLGVHGCTVLTAVTAQNTKAVTAVQILEPKMIEAQIEALDEDLPPAAVKTGMLADEAGIRTIAAFLEKSRVPYVCDPVMISTSGARLISDEAAEAMKTCLIPRSNILTPNLDEAAALWGRPISCKNDMEQAAQALLQLGAGSVLLKGGHLEGRWCSDFWTDGQTSFWLHGPRIETKHTHGSGCTMAAALTAHLAMGLAPIDAVVAAKAYMNGAVRAGGAVGEENGPVLQGPFPCGEEDMPVLTETSAYEKPEPFQACGDLGFYPIVDRVSWLERLLPLGVETVQLRIKDLTGSALEAEIEAAVRLSKAYDVKLFVNDYWQIALKYGAYGVHLGQDDLAESDIETLRKSGIRLGISTHCWYEVARAHALRPSYIAVGPVYATKTKDMPWIPAGPANLTAWRKRLEYPMVAIGGINLDRLPAVLETGVTGVAVITAITAAADPEGEVPKWLQHFAK